MSKQLALEIPLKLDLTIAIEPVTEVEEALAEEIATSETSTPDKAPSELPKPKIIKDVRIPNN